MSDMSFPAKSATSGNTTTPSKVMTDAQVQGSGISADPDVCLDVLENFLLGIGTAHPSDASAKLTTSEAVKKPVSLMTLPGELRNRIYHDYFAAQGAALNGQGERRIHRIHPDDVDNICVCNTDSLVPWATPSSGRMLDVNLLFACKQAYRESKPIFLEKRLVQVQMHGMFDLHVAQALQQALRLELCVEWSPTSWTACPHQFLEILTARDDLKEFNFRVGKDDPRLRHDDTFGKLIGGVRRIRASKVSLVNACGEEKCSKSCTDTADEFHARMRRIEAEMTR
ncbi:hypothetical protein FKW77_010737 [Venturia effusa]|uniref:Uncharacterized protein n=1 Tax=Venturia effusa TaxID=50376 RepID=A0A517KYC4_9PEZI|nr:hypothetical protein FKW77_010737 [Venturia effusa]